MSSLQLGRADYYYVGSFDDEILRNQQSTSLSLDSINETLLQAALFGGPLLINDGYLMLYAAGRQALTDRATSPLLDLIDEGYVFLFSRNGGKLSEMPEQMAHIDTYYTLIHSGKKWHRLKFQLEELDRRLRHKPSAIKPWPKVNLGSGFVRLVNQALVAYDRRPSNGSPLTPHQLDLLLKAFNDEMGSNPNGAARTVWRNQYERPEFGISLEGRSLLHWLGIEAYHYNLAMAASIGDNNDTLIPGVITRHSYLFEELNQHSRPHMDEGCAPQKIPTPSVSRAISQRVLRKGQFLKEVVKNGTELNNAKIEYLLAVQNALQDRQALQEASLAAINYEKAIKTYAMDEFSEEIADWWDRNLEYVTIVLQGGTQTATSAVMAHYGVTDPTLVNLATNVVAPMIGLFVRDKAEKVREKKPDLSVNLVVDSFDPLPEYSGELVNLEESLQGAHWFGLLKIKPQLARDHVRELPQF